MKALKKYPVEIIFSIGFIIVGAILNTQFLEGSNVNYDFSAHDEYLTVREVYGIVNPISFRHFCLAIMSGDVLMYGRMMFYTDAIFAFLPFKIWGITGMVYAIRMTHVIVLVSAASILSGTFLRKALGKFIFLAVALTMYYTTYFAMLPKPEPLQLLLLALFLRVAVKRNWAFGNHFILLGMAFGVKFNILTILPIFFLLPFLTEKRVIKEFVFSGLYFLAGLLIAVPCLLLSPVKPVFLQAYLSYTFFNTAHYGDTGVVPIEWIKEGWFGIYLGGLVFGLIVVALIAWALIVSLKSYFKDKRIDENLVILLCGLGLLLPVLLFTKRLWPHYLWTGNLLLFLALASYIQKDLFNKRGQMIFTLGMVISLIGCFKISLQKNGGIFSLEENRQQEIQNGKRAYNYLNGLKANFVAVQDVSVFYPFEQFLEYARYHPFRTEYPYPVPERSYIWLSFVYPTKLQETEANFLLVRTRDFENTKSTSSTNSRGDRMIVMYDSLLRSELGKTIFRDTVFGSLKIYRIKNEGK